jgi:hypothetical protein
MATIEMPAKLLFLTHLFLQICVYLDAVRFGFDGRCCEHRGITAPRLREYRRKVVVQLTITLRRHVVVASWLLLFSGTKRGGIDIFPRWSVCPHADQAAVSDNGGELFKRLPASFRRQIDVCSGAGGKRIVWINVTRLLLQDRDYKVLRTCSYRKRQMLWSSFAGNGAQFGEDFS